MNVQCSIINQAQWPFIAKCDQCECQNHYTTNKEHTRIEHEAQVECQATCLVNVGNHSQQFKS